jgi:hypothetical protein
VYAVCGGVVRKQYRPDRVHALSSGDHFTAAERQGNELRMYRGVHRSERRSV